LDAQVAGQQPVRGGLPAATEAFASTKANRTSMAHRGLSDDRRLVFSHVELRGLEPLTPCLQNRPKLSEIVAHLGMRQLARPLGSGRVGCCCGQAWWSPFTWPEAIRMHVII